MGLKRKINTLRRHPSIIADVVQGRAWKEIEGKVDALDENETRLYVANMKKRPPSCTSDPYAQLNLNKVCCIEDFENIEVRQALSDIRKLNPDGLIHRKDWEWAMGIIALHRLGKLDKKCTAIGIGAGTEVMPFYLANKIGHVYATDLYEAKEWQAAAPLDFPDNPRKYAPFPYREDALTALRMNGTKLDFPSESFDVVFSFSSIEHFGGRNHSGALKSLKEMERVLRPGGVAIVATEYIINNKEHHEFFNERTIYSDLIHKVKALRLVEPLDLNITVKTLDTVLDFFRVDMNWDKFDDDFKRQHPLILLRVRNILFTSIMLVFQKAKL